MENQVKDSMALVRASEPDHLPAVISPFSGVDSFEAAQRMATLLANSTMVPEVYRGENGVSNCVVALEVSSRMRVSPLMLMQNMAIIEGRPALSAQFLIAMVNACRKFTPLRYKMRDLGQKEVSATIWEGPKGQRVKKEIRLTIHDKGCRAWAKELATGEELEGPEITLEMAVAEGWYTRNGSKWKTMPDVMLTYRAAAFFSRMYAPEMALGMHTSEEREDMRAGSIDVETIPIGDGSVAPAEVIPARATRAPRAPKAQPAVVDAETVTEKAPEAPPAATPPPPPAPAPAAPPAPVKPKNASATTGIPRRTAAPPAAAPEGTPEQAKVKAWMGEHTITMAELNSALLEYRGEEVNAGAVSALNPEQIAFLIENADAIADAIKGSRV